MEPVDNFYYVRLGYHKSMSESLRRLFVEITKHRRPLCYLFPGAIVYYLPFLSVGLCFEASANLMTSEVHRVVESRLAISLKSFMNIYNLNLCR